METQSVLLSTSVFKSWLFVPLACLFILKMLPLLGKLLRLLGASLLWLSSLCFLLSASWFVFFSLISVLLFEKNKLSFGFEIPAFLISLNNSAKPSMERLTLFRSRYKPGE